jgi:hypothetical protein
MYRSRFPGASIRRSSPAAACRAGTTLDGFTVTFADQRFDESSVARIVAHEHAFATTPSR